MTVFEKFETKKEAKQYKKEHGGKIAYAKDRFGRSKNKDEYLVASCVLRWDRKKYPYCVMREVPVGA